MKATPTALFDITLNHKSTCSRFSFFFFCFFLPPTTHTHAHTHLLLPFVASCIAKTPSLSSPQGRRSPTSELQPLDQHQPQHKHQVRAQFAAAGARHPLRLPPPAAAARLQPAGGPGTLARRQPQLLLQLVRRQRPRGPPAGLPLPAGTGEAPCWLGGQGEPLGQAPAHGHVGDIKIPSWASSHQPVREGEG